MKHLLSLLCATLVVLSASAVKPLPSQVAHRSQAAELKLGKAHAFDQLRGAKPVMFKAPAATQDVDFSATLTDLLAAYYGGSSSYSSDDWEFMFYAGNSMVVYMDVYQVGDATHIDGTYDFDNGSIGEAFVVVAPGDTLDITSGSLTVLHNTATNYNFSALLYAEDGQEITFEADLDVEAIDYYEYYLSQYGYGSDYYIELEDQPFELTGVTVQVPVASTDVDDYYYDEDYADYGYDELIFSGWTADGEYYAQFDLHIGTSIAGSYTEDDLEKSYSGFYHVVGTDTVYVGIKEAQITITYSDPNGSIDATIVGKDGNIYHVTMSFSYSFTTSGGGTGGGGGSTTTGMEYDSETADFNHSYALTDISYDRRYLATYGSIMLEASDATTTIVLDFNLIGGAEDPNIVIPAGTYTIDETYNFGTVTASAGVEGTSVYASFAANTNAEGNLTIPMWFLENGQVTVSNVNGNIHVVVAATNSYGRAINVVIGASTALENVDSEKAANKFIKDGQLLIEKNGKLYNALGTEMK